MMTPDRRKPLFFLILIPLLSACAWGYAGEEGKVADEPQPEMSTKVVELDASAQATPEAQSGAQPQAQQPAQQQAVVRESTSPQVAEPQSPCGVSTFTIRRYTAEGVVEKVIDCRERKTVKVKRMSLSHAQFEQARSDGLPEGSWYLLVDPKGLRAKFLSNAELIKISKHFEVEYLRKDRRRGLLIYEYRDAVR